MTDAAPGTDDRDAGASRSVIRGREFLAKIITLRWVPLTAALLSLPLSAAAILISLQHPEVIVILPDQVRISQGRESGAAYVTSSRPS